MKTYYSQARAQGMRPRTSKQGNTALPWQPVMMRRRTFMSSLMLGASALAVGCGDDKKPPTEPPAGVYVPEVKQGEDLFEYMERTRGGFDQTLYNQLVGAANPYKEGDEAAKLAAADEVSRTNARTLLSNTTIGELRAHPFFDDGLYQLIEQGVDSAQAAQVAGMTMGELKRFLLDKSEAEIKAMMGGLSSDVIGCVVKLMTNEELIAVGSKVFNPLPGSKLGAKGYLGARIQPNSPTDNVDDIRWQVFDGWAYGVGDVVLGTNPVSSDVNSVAAVHLALKDVLVTFGLEQVFPHCVLAHIDIQAEVETLNPGSTALWFQSLGSTEGANKTFDVTIPKMLDHAAKRTGQYGLYFETGQGADATNGHGNGFDMVVHESRKYGFARVLKEKVAAAQLGAGKPAQPWVHLNDVAGFIGPEVFRSKEQLVRCCLEDIVMGKLHGLMIGLDVCSTLHMEVTLDDLDWCLDQIMPANPGYLMALPTKNDPMLSYLTTAFQDHVRIRNKFGYKVEDRMWQFFQQLGVVDAQGNPGPHFGDPTWVYLQYRRRKGDTRPDADILAEARAQITEVDKRGVFIAEGHGTNTWDLNPQLDSRVRFLYEDAKASIFAELPATFAATLTQPVAVATESKDREDYILHPPTGELLSADALTRVRALRDSHAGRYDVQIVISDGLNALALTDEGHLAPYLQRVRTELEAAGFKVAPEHLVVTGGRVRAGYRIGETLFGSLGDRNSRRAILHVIGERPGSGHRAYSVYITAPNVETWAQQGMVDHNITRVVSGIADTALLPTAAAVETVNILKQMAPR
ncbi:MAG TPA: ethanolamine ammonia-lyase subunit EutB [Myxococcaceae bacterium]|jgi:ethanolamine ammonia-lyase large subunit